MDAAVVNDLHELSLNREQEAVILERVRFVPNDAGGLNGNGTGA